MKFKKATKKKLDMKTIYIKKNSGFGVDHHMEFKANIDGDSILTTVLVTLFMIGVLFGLNRGILGVGLLIPLVCSAVMLMIYLYFYLRKIVSYELNASCVVIKR
ncbi:MAG: hypothetical protein HYZ42_15085, partial [Bacteroidetes bacterium]|nr:hypothetical protein [Bacteroidota bacterium]